MRPPFPLLGKRILVVDDNETNIRIVHGQIISWGVRNGSPRNGEDALAILKRESQKGDAYDMAILDMQMPGMDGLTLARRIKDDPILANTHLVLMTSMDGVDPKDSESAGIDALLTKPVRQSVLHDTLVNVLSRDKRYEKPNSLANAQQTGTPFGGRKIRILLAEDNAVNQQIAVMQLQKLGISVDAVANGLEVLTALKSISYDLVLMDCQMPEMDGYQATQEFRKTETPGTRLPIIAMTANALRGDDQKCISAGMDAYISKPVDVEKLNAVLQKWLNVASNEKKAA